MLNRHVFGLAVARLQIFVQRGKNLMHGAGYEHMIRFQITSMSSCMGKDFSMSNECSVEQYERTQQCDLAVKNIKPEDIP